MGGWWVVAVLFLLSGVGGLNPHTNNEPTQTVGTALGTEVRVCRRVGVHCMEGPAGVIPGTREIPSGTLECKWGGRLSFPKKKSAD